MVVVYEETQMQKEQQYGQVFDYIWEKEMMTLISEMPALLQERMGSTFRSNIAFTVLIEFLKMELIFNINRECLIDRSDAVHSHLRMLYALGQSTNPSEGINTRTACLEALTQLHRV